MPGNMVMISHLIMHLVHVFEVIAKSLMESGSFVNVPSLPCGWEEYVGRVGEFWTSDETTGTDSSIVESLVREKV